MPGKVSREALRNSGGDDRVAITISLPRHLVLLLAAKAAQIEASVSSLLKNALEGHYKDEKSVDARAVAKGILNMQCLRKDQDRLSQNLGLEPEDFPQETGGSAFALNPQDEIPAAKETSHGKKVELEDIMKRLTVLQNEISKIKSS